MDNKEKRIKKTILELIEVLEKNDVTITDIAKYYDTQKCKVNSSSKKLESRELEIQISEILKQLGFPLNLRGYLYLREALVLTVNDFTLIDNITKELYPRIAEKYETTPQKVERSMRHAIEVAWTRGKAEQFEKMFGYTVMYDKGKPTNSEFVALIADSLRLHM